VWIWSWCTLRGGRCLCRWSGCDGLSAVSMCSASYVFLNDWSIDMTRYVLWCYVEEQVFSYFHIQHVMSSFILASNVHVHHKINVHPRLHSQPYIWSINRHYAHLQAIYVLIWDQYIKNPTISLLCSSYLHAYTSDLPSARYPRHPWCLEAVISELKAELN